MIIDILKDRIYKIGEGKFEIIHMKNINALVGKVEGKTSFEIVYSKKFNIISLIFNNGINDEIFKIVREYSSINCEIKFLKKEENLVVVIFKYLKV